MRQHNEHFEEFIQKRLNENEGRRVNDRQGVIMEYDRRTNTATVALSSQDSDIVGSILKKVPCPSYNGIQMIAPEEGRSCWVVFKGGRESQPYVTHFFNHDFGKFDYRRMYRAGNDIPKYLTR